MLADAEAGCRFTNLKEAIVTLDAFSRTFVLNLVGKPSRDLGLRLCQDGYQRPQLLWDVD